MKENLDNLHAVVTAARARKQAGYDGKDVWRDDLQPRAAVRARTVPLLEQERDRLRAELAQVRSHSASSPCQPGMVLMTPVCAAHTREHRAAIGDAAERAGERGGRSGGREAS